MAQIATIASLAIAGVSAYNQAQQQRQRRAETRVQQQAAREQQIAQQQVITTQAAPLWPQWCAPALPAGRVAGPRLVL